MDNLRGSFGETAVAPEYKEMINFKTQRDFLVLSITTKLDILKASNLEEGVRNDLMDWAFCCIDLDGLIMKGDTGGATKRLAELQTLTQQLLEHLKVILPNLGNDYEA